MTDLDLDAIYAGASLRSQEIAEEKYGAQARAYVESVTVTYPTESSPSITFFPSPVEVQANVRIYKPPTKIVTTVRVA